jgi:hypothetical protein
VLIRTLCNELVSKVRSHLDASTIFDMEPLQAVEKLMAALKVRERPGIYIPFRSSGVPKSEEGGRNYRRRHICP